jgi:type IV pilus assembly protein PilM
VLFKKSKNLVGLDIGSSAIKLVELKDSKAGGYRLVKTGLESLSPEAIVDGAIMDSSLVVDTVNRIVSTLNVRNPDFGTSLSGHSVIIKKISLPAMSPEELAESIRWEAEQYVPFDINDVNLDYVVLESGGGETMDVLLVAVKKDKIGDYTSVITQAGKTPVLVDVDAFALQNAYEVNYGTEPGAVVVLLNAGASATNINILEGDQSVFTRDISTGGNAYTEALQKELNLPFEQADQLKRGEAVDGVSFDDARPVLRAVTENLMLEIQKTFDFYKASASFDRITKIVVSGGASRAEAFTEMLNERFQAPVEFFDPFQKVVLDGAKLQVDAAEIGPTVAVAVGLALRRAGDR